MASGAQSARRDGPRPADAASAGGGVDTAQRELGAGQHQAQHQRLVVDAGDQVHEQQRITGPSHSALTSATPQRRASRGVAQTIRPDTEQYDYPMAQYRSHDVVAGQLGDAAADPQEQRSVRRRRLTPQARHRQGEHMVQPKAGGRTDPVGVQADPAIWLCAR